MGGEERLFLVYFLGIFFEAFEERVGAGGEPEEDEDGGPPGPATGVFCVGVEEGGAGEGAGGRGGEGDEVGHGEERLAGFVAEGGDHFRGDGRGGIAEGVADVGEDGGDLFVGLESLGGHGGGEGVFDAVDPDGAGEAAELDADEVFGWAVDPIGSGEGRAEVGDAFSIGAVTGLAKSEGGLAGFHDGWVEVVGEFGGGGLVHGFLGQEGGGVEEDGFLGRRGGGREVGL